jgi:hypothetical protein
MLHQKLFVWICIFAAILGAVSVTFASGEGLTLTLNSTATISAGRSMLTVSGTVTCPVGHSLDGIYVQVFQQRGNRQISSSENLFPYSGYGNYEYWTCTGGPLPWAITLRTGAPIDGLWQPGPVSVVATGSACHLIPDEYEWGYGMICENGSNIIGRIDARLHAG